MPNCTTTTCLIDGQIKPELPPGVSANTPCGATPCKCGLCGRPTNARFDRTGRGNSRRPMMVSLATPVPSAPTPAPVATPAMSQTPAPTVSLGSSQLLPTRAPPASTALGGSTTMRPMTPLLFAPDVPLEAKLAVLPSLNRTPVEPAPPAPMPSLAMQTAPSGAPTTDSPDECYRQYLGLSLDTQARIAEDGATGRYDYSQQAAQDLRNGAVGAGRAFADWLFQNFPRNSVEIREFCMAVRAAMPYAPGGAPYDGGTGGILLDTPYIQPAGAVETVLDPASVKLVFARLPPYERANLLRTSIALRDSFYPQSLATAIETGQNYVNGYPVNDLFFAWLANHVQPNSPEHRLFVYDLALAGQRAGLLARPAGDPPTTPARPPASTNPPQGSAPAAANPPPGFSAAQWNAVIERDPALAARLWQEWQNRPSTFTQVSQSIMQAADRVLQGVHQGRLDDLEQQRLDYANRQAMARIEQEREQQRAQRDMTALERERLAAQQASQGSIQPYVAPPTPPPPPAQPTEDTESWSTGTKVAVGGAVVVAVGAAVTAGVMLSRRKKNDSAKRRAAKARKGKAKKTAKKGS